MSTTTQSPDIRDTGNDTLNELIADLTPEAAAAALAVFEVCRVDETFGYVLRDALGARLGRFLHNHHDDGKRDFAAEVLPTHRWLAFVDGYLAAQKEGRDDRAGTRRLAVQGALKKAHATD